MLVAHCGFTRYLRLHTTHRFALHAFACRTARYRTHRYQFALPFTTAVYHALRFACLPHCARARLRYLAPAAVPAVLPHLPAAFCSSLRYWFTTATFHWLPPLHCHHHFTWLVYRTAAVLVCHLVTDTVWVFTWFYRTTAALHWFTATCACTCTRRCYHYIPRGLHCLRHTAGSYARGLRCLPATCRTAVPLHGCLPPAYCLHRTTTAATTAYALRLLLRFTVCYYRLRIGLRYHCRLLLPRTARAAFCVLVAACRLHGSATLRLLDYTGSLLHWFAGYCLRLCCAPLPAVPPCWFALYRLPHTWVGSFTAFAVLRYLLRFTRACRAHTALYHHTLPVLPFCLVMRVGFALHWLCAATCGWVTRRLRVYAHRVLRTHRLPHCALPVVFCARLFTCVWFTALRTLRTTPRSAVNAAHCTHAPGSHTYACAHVLPLPRLHTHRAYILRLYRSFGSHAPAPATARHTAHYRTPGSPPRAVAVLQFTPLPVYTRRFWVAVTHTAVYGYFYGYTRLRYTAHYYAAVLRFTHYWFLPTLFALLRTACWVLRGYFTAYIFTFCARVSRGSALLCCRFWLVLCAVHLPAYALVYTLPHAFTGSAPVRTPARLLLPRCAVYAHCFTCTTVYVSTQFGLRGSFGLVWVPGYGSCYCTHTHTRTLPALPAVTPVRSFSFCGCGSTVTTRRWFYAHRLHTHRTRYTHTAGLVAFGLVHTFPPLPHRFTFGLVCALHTCGFAFYPRVTLRWFCAYTTRLHTGLPHRSHTARLRTLRVYARLVWLVLATRSAHCLRLRFYGSGLRCHVHAPVLRFYAVHTPAVTHTAFWFTRYTAAYTLRIFTFATGSPFGSGFTLRSHGSRRTVTTFYGCILPRLRTRTDTPHYTAHLRLHHAVTVWILHTPRVYLTVGCWVYVRHYLRFTHYAHGSTRYRTRGCWLPFTGSHRAGAHYALHGSHGWLVTAPPPPATLRLPAGSPRTCCRTLRLPRLRFAVHHRTTCVRTRFYTFTGCAVFAHAVTWFCGFLAHRCHRARLRTCGFGFTCHTAVHAPGLPPHAHVWFTHRITVPVVQYIARFPTHYVTVLLLFSLCLPLLRRSYRRAAAHRTVWFATPHLRAFTRFHTPRLHTTPHFTTHGCTTAVPAGFHHRTRLRFAYGLRTVGLRLPVTHTHVLPLPLPRLRYAHARFGSRTAVTRFTRLRGLVCVHGYRFTPHTHAHARLPRGLRLRLPHAYTYTHVHLHGLVLPTHTAPHRTHHAFCVILRFTRFHRYLRYTPPPHGSPHVHTHTRWLGFGSAPHAATAHTTHVTPHLRFTHTHYAFAFTHATCGSRTPHCHTFLPLFYHGLRFTRYTTFPFDHTTAHWLRTFTVLPATTPVRGFGYTFAVVWVTLRLGSHVTVCHGLRYMHTCTHTVHYVLPHTFCVTVTQFTHTLPHTHTPTVLRCWVATGWFTFGFTLRYTGLLPRTLRFTYYAAVLGSRTLLHCICLLPHFMDFACVLGYGYRVFTHALRTLCCGSRRVHAFPGCRCHCSSAHTAHCHTVTFLPPCLHLVWFTGCAHHAPVTVAVHRFFGYAAAVLRCYVTLRGFTARAPAAVWFGLLQVALHAHPPRFLHYRTTVTLHFAARLDYCVLRFHARFAFYGLRFCCGYHTRFHCCGYRITWVYTAATWLPRTPPADAVIHRLHRSPPRWLPSYHRAGSAGCYGFTLPTVYTGSRTPRATGSHCVTTAHGYTCAHGCGCTRGSYALRSCTLRTRCAHCHALPARTRTFGYLRLPGLLPVGLHGFAPDLRVHAHRFGLPPAHTAPAVWFALPYGLRYRTAVLRLGLLHAVLHYTLPVHCYSSPRFCGYAHHGLLPPHWLCTAVLHYGYHTVTGSGYTAVQVLPHTHTAVGLVVSYRLVRFTHYHVWFCARWVGYRTLPFGYTCVLPGLPHVHTALPGCGYTHTPCVCTHTLPAAAFTVHRTATVYTGCHRLQVLHYHWFGLPRTVATAAHAAVHLLFTPLFCTATTIPYRCNVTTTYHCGSFGSRSLRSTRTTATATRTLRFCGSRTRTVTTFAALLAAFWLRFYARAHRGSRGCGSPPPLLPRLVHAYLLTVFFALRFAAPHTRFPPLHTTVWFYYTIPLPAVWLVGCSAHFSTRRSLHHHTGYVCGSTLRTLHRTAGLPRLRSVLRGSHAPATACWFTPHVLRSLRLLHHHHAHRLPVTPLVRFAVAVVTAAQVPHPRFLRTTCSYAILHTHTLMLRTRLVWFTVTHRGSTTPHSLLPLPAFTAVTVTHTFYLPHRLLVCVCWFTFTAAHPYTTDYTVHTPFDYRTVFAVWFGYTRLLPVCRLPGSLPTQLPLPLPPAPLPPTLLRYRFALLPPRTRFYLRFTVSTTVTHGFTTTLVAVTHYAHLRVHARCTLAVWLVWFRLLRGLPRYYGSAIRGYGLVYATGLPPHAHSRARTAAVLRTAYRARRRGYHAGYAALVHHTTRAHAPLRFCYWLRGFMLHTHHCRATLVFRARTTAPHRFAHCTLPALCGYAVPQLRLVTRITFWLRLRFWFAVTGFAVPATAACHHHAAVLQVTAALLPALVHHARRAAFATRFPHTVPRLPRTRGLRSLRSAVLPHHAAVHCWLHTWMRFYALPPATAPHLPAVVFCYHLPFLPLHHHCYWLHLRFRGSATAAYHTTVCGSTFKFTARFAVCGLRGITTAVLGLRGCGCTTGFTITTPARFYLPTAVAAVATLLRAPLPHAFSAALPVAAALLFAVLRFCYYARTATATALLPRSTVPLPPVARLPLPFTACVTGLHVCVTRITHGCSSPHLTGCRTVHTRTVQLLVTTVTHFGLLPARFTTTHGLRCCAHRAVHARYWLGSLHTRGYLPLPLVAILYRLVAVLHCRFATRISPCGYVYRLVGFGFCSSLLVSRTGLPAARSCVTITVYCGCFAGFTVTTTFFFTVTAHCWTTPFGCYRGSGLHTLLRLGWFTAVHTLCRTVHHTTAHLVSGSAAHRILLRFYITRTALVLRLRLHRLHAHTFLPFTLLPAPPHTAALLHTVYTTVHCVTVHHRLVTFYTFTVLPAVTHRTATVTPLPHTCRLLRVRLVHATFWFAHGYGYYVLRFQLRTACRSFTHTRYRTCGYTVHLPRFTTVHTAHLRFTCRAVTVAVHAGYHAHTVAFGFILLPTAVHRF